MNSAPAHVSYPTVHIKLEGEAEEGVVIVKDENKVELGTLEDSNHRIINKYIVTGQVESCQLAMGLTKLLPGSVWNTMPSHTHDRRMEVYLYFDMDDDSFVMHYIDVYKRQPQKNPNGFPIGASNAMFSAWEALAE